MGILSWLAGLFDDRPRPPAPAPAPAPLPVNAGTTSDAVLAEVNALRARHGLRPLASGAPCVASANRWAARMAGGVGKTHGIGLLSFRNRMADARLDGFEVGECIEEGPPDAASVVAAWAADPPHRFIMLGPDYTRGGAGMVVDRRGTPYWVLDLASGVDP